MTNLAESTERSFAAVNNTDILKIKELCTQGKFEEANDLAVKTSEWKEGGEGNRHPCFVMFIDMDSEGDIRNYKRLCNFKTGEITISWKVNRGYWKRRCFVSRKDNVVVQELKAPLNSKISCSIRLDIDSAMYFSKGMKFIKTALSNELRFQAYYSGNKDAGYECITRIVVSRGRTNVFDNQIFIRNAKSILLLTCTEKYYHNVETAFQKDSISKILKQLPIHSTYLINEHNKIHQTIYDRVNLSLNATQADRCKTNEELLAEQIKSEKPITALWERLFDAGRYIFLSSSSEQSPPDLLGIWTGDCNAGWGGYYHLDANLNLQVSGGNIGNMPEIMEGYFHIFESWEKDFKTNAEKLLGCRGLLACGNNTPGNRGLMAAITTYYLYQYATGEAPWLLYPFWEHYLVTGDTIFLKQWLFPSLKDMGEFYEDFLTQKDDTGRYIFAGSVSPENQPSNRKISLLNNSAFDVSGTKFVLSSLLQTCKILHLENEEDNYNKWENLFKNLPNYLVNEDNVISEWAWAGLKDNYNHRHSSQLMMIYPYRELNPEKDLLLFNPALETLKQKDQFDYENAGHGLLHSALIAAGLKNSASVENKLLRLTREGFYYNSLSSSHYVNKKVFCTDVCNTFPTIIMEMLISTSPGELELLPDLPASLPSGEVDGIKGRNQITIDKLIWNQKNKKVSCFIHSEINQQIDLIFRQGIKKIISNCKVKNNLLGQVKCRLNLLSGHNYYLTIETK